MLTFAWPWVFLLLPLPWLIDRLQRQWRQPVDEAALRVPFYNTVNELDKADTLGAAPTTAARWRWWLAALAWLALVTALARPFWVGEPIEQQRSGRDMMLAVDVSGSMDTKDMVVNGTQTSRINAVKKVVSDFLKQREGDRVGLILFGTQAYLQAPLTADLDTVKTFLLEAQLGIAGKATAIGDAIGQAIKQLRKRPAENRVLILLTDGENTAGNVDPLQAANLAKDTGITIYTVGVGSDDPPAPGLLGNFFNSSLLGRGAEIDEATLTAIADTAGGRYFRARNAPELELIYEALNQLEAIEQDIQVFRPQISLLHWPLLASLVISVLLYGERIQWRRLLPGGEAPS